MKYVSLHHHSTYSPLDGFGLPESHVERAAEVDMEALALTEHGSISSHVPLEKASKKTGIKAIFGVELYCGGVDEKNHSQTKNHMTVLAENQAGYRNLTQLVTRTWEQFYYEPTASKEDLNEFKEGLIFLSGCTGSELAASLVGGKQFTEGGDYRRSRRIASAAKSTFGSSYFLEVQAFPELEKVRELNVAMERLSKELRIPLVATCDIHYTKPNENEMQQILHNVRGGNKKTLEEQARGWGYSVPLCHPWSDAYVYARLRATGLSSRAARGAILAAAEIGERCNVTLPKLPRLRYPLPVGVASANDLWRQWIKDGWTYRGFHRLTPSVAAQYRERLKYEMGIIEGKDFIDYFLVVSDIVKFAKDSGIPVGPARGSAAASLVCFLLRITEVNPMLFPNLVFERFIDVTRQDLPDIDLDFDDSRRSEIRDYAVGKYGAGQVSNIGTFTQYRSKNSLEDIARVYRIPKYRVDEVKELLIERSSGDLRASSTVEDTVLMFAQAKAVFDENPDLYKAMALEGNIRGMGVHAAGLVVSSGPLADVCALYTREDKTTGETLTAVSVNKYDAEYLNILKIDILSLKTMGMIANALKLMGMTLDELYAVPLTDKKTIRGFQKNDCVGIFQFDGRAMRNITGELKPDSFKEICDINALARPGPLHNGATSEYIDTKWGRKEPRRYHPLLDRICSDTHYQIVYQEQILRIVVEIGLFEWTHAAYIRKIISQKIGEQEFARQWERFWQGAQTHEGMTEEIAHTIWNQCITAGTYAFCCTGDTVVVRGGAGGNRSGGAPQTPEITLAELYTAQQSNTAWGDKLRDPRRGIQILQMDDDGRIRPRKLIKVHEPVMRPIIKIETKDGRTLRMSKEHRLLTAEGYVLADKLKAGMKLVAMGEADWNAPKGRHQQYHENPGHVAETGPHNPAWIDGRTPALVEAKAAVLARSGGRCEHCSAKGQGDSHDLEFAHILHLDDLGGDYLKYNSEGNLLHLCNSCHKKFDYKKGERKRRWTRGRLTVLDEIVSIKSDGEDLVYDVTMEQPNHNFVSNGLISHNNAAHCVSYGLLAYWTMYIKQHFPKEFYTASLQKYDKEKALGIMQDAERHGIKILPPSVKVLAPTWTPDPTLLAVRAGLEQIPGIGEKTANNILNYNKQQPINRWIDLIDIKGIGTKTIEKIEEFVHTDDPFGIHKLERQLNRVRKELREFKFGEGFPVPTHKADQVPYNRGEDEEVIWLGVVTHRNLRDLFELHFSRTGEKLDPEAVKDPDLREWVVLVGVDETETLTITCDRWRYPRFKRALWDIKLDHDLILVRGLKRGFQSRRAIYIRDLIVLDPGE